MSIELLLMTAAGARVGAITYNQTRVAIEPSGSEGKKFGSSVAIRGNSGEVLWVGQENATVSGVANAGIVWKYYESPSNVSIYQYGGANIVGPTVANTRFGWSIDATPTGNWIIASGPGQSPGPDGYARLIQDSTSPMGYGLATVRANFSPSVASNYDFFGLSVSIDNTGNTVVIGEPGYSISVGAVNNGRVLRYTGGNTTWTLANTYYQTSGNSNSVNLGWSTATNANGTYVSGGAIRDVNASGITTGASYVFSTLQATQRQIEIPTPDNTNSDSMGYVVKINDDATTLAVSAPESDAFGNWSGVVYVYKRVPPAATWTLFKTISCPDINDSTIRPYNFGQWMDMNSDGTVLAIGTNRSTVGSPITYIFKLVGGGSWDYTGKCLVDNTATPGITIIPSSISSISLNSIGNVLAVGHDNASINSVATGIVAIYKNI